MAGKIHFLFGENYSKEENSITDYFITVKVYVMRGINPIFGANFGSSLRGGIVRGMCRYAAAK
ncbi:MAG: hypothetical protein P4L87_01015 [Formivibrio sp.]|nr:hypothetical protein [Formivibrio sp.]